MFQLTGYDPRSPALYVHPDGAVEWRVSPQNAKMMYYERQEAIITKPSDFERLSELVVARLMREYDAETVEELWESLRHNAVFNAPGTELDGCVPAAELPQAPRSTTRTRRRGLRVKPEALRAFEGPSQAVHIARWLADQHPEKVIDDDSVETSLFLMQRVNPIKTRQSVILVYQYYRPRFIKCGGLIES